MGAVALKGAKAEILSRIPFCLWLATMRLATWESKLIRFSSSPRPGEGGFHVRIDALAALACSFHRSKFHAHHEEPQEHRHVPEEAADQIVGGQMVYERA